MRTGKKYYVVLLTEKILEMQWKGDNYDKKWLQEERIFLEKEKAEELLEIIKTVKEYSWKLKNTDLSSKSPKYYAEIDNDGELCISSAYIVFDKDKPYFKNKSDIYKALNKVGNENFKRVVKFYNIPNSTNRG